MSSKILNIVCALSAGTFVACSHHNHHDMTPDNGTMTHNNDTTTSNNIFTGSKTVTKTDEQTYKNNDTGAKSKRTVTKKVKYDKNGNKISDSKQVDNSAR